MKEDSLEIFRSEIEYKRNEIKRLQIEASKISKLKTDIIILEKAVKILSGEDPPSPAESSTEVDLFKKETIAQVIYFILKDACTPMDIKEIEQESILRGKQISRANLNSAVYRAISMGKLFKLTAPGIFGLLEWESRM